MGDGEATGRAIGQPEKTNHTSSISKIVLLETHLENDRFVCAPGPPFEVPGVKGGGGEGAHSAVGPAQRVWVHGYKEFRAGGLRV